MDIKWKDGAVCFATNEQRYANDDVEYIVSNTDKTVSFNSSRAISSHDFQLNEPRIGDYIPKSELDTEQKYNDAAEVFGLFGFKSLYSSYHDYSSENKLFFIDEGRTFIGGLEFFLNLKRKITYSQLMVIGKLKRLMNERDSKSGLGNEAPDLTPDIEPAKEVTMQKNKPVVAQVMIDLTERMEIGIKTYGEALRANNGRDALQDAYEEALDLACYLKQAMIERDNANTN